jgi:hypothetical protein
VDAPAQRDPVAVLASERHLDPCGVGDAHAGGDHGPRRRVVGGGLGHREEAWVLALQRADHGIGAAEGRPRLATPLEPQHPGDLVSHPRRIVGRARRADDAVAVLPELHGDGLEGRVHAEGERQRDGVPGRHSAAGNESRVEVGRRAERERLGCFDLESGHLVLRRTV